MSKKSRSITFRSLCLFLFQDHKIRLNQNDRKELLVAKTEGDLHEKMLDRRAKMKADRYCK